MDDIDGTDVLRTVFNGRAVFVSGVRSEPDQEDDRSERGLFAEPA